jgi:acyl-homoserine lactone acylase PvdQ|tara:strand:- start:5 stop:310 length:306 start_codon:yes stop_codon:yes gene_type:complete
MRDKIIERVINKIKSRSDVGYKKYGVTLHDDDQTLDKWLTHIQEELMDAVNYIEKAKSVLTDEIEEAMLNREWGDNADMLIGESEFNKNIANINVDEEEIL